jgi:hypothetical protein
MHPHLNSYSDKTWTARRVKLSKLESAKEMACIWLVSGKPLHQNTTQIPCQHHKL